MSEKQPKLKFEEDKERTATRSPPKKSKVEQSVPKKQKLKQDADKAAEKSQHLRFGKAEITPDEASFIDQCRNRLWILTVILIGIVVIQLFRLLDMVRIHMYRLIPLSCRNFPSANQ